tara:strand:- start:319 stop:699 length:381 start_codon:yes stop_codon:yes gene_type:complete
MNNNNFLIIAIYFCIIGIVLGAFGAHFLKELISENLLNSYQTGIRYQMIHALTILILSLNTKKFNSLLNLVLLTMTIGTILFSFSIYMLTMQSLISLSLNFLGIITPIGGILLIVSWILLLFCIKK